VSWDERELNEREVRGAPGLASPKDLASKIDILIEQQKRTWPLLARGYSALASVETKPLAIEKSQVFAHHNPGRIKSTSARVDKESVEKRACFLCAENLPPEEKAIRYGDDFMIMCNPFPILDHHLSIVHREHIPQKITGNVGALLSLAEDLASHFFVLFNGAQCGASAPDHLHFQACARKLLPIEEDLRRLDSSGERDENTIKVDGVEALSLSDCGRNVIAFRSADRAAMERVLSSALGLLSRLTGRPEPMINLIVTGDFTGGNSALTAYLFPRERHRPSYFFAEGEDHLMISPGAIDMAGVVVVPEASDFRKIDARHVRRIYQEVTLEDETMRQLMKAIEAGARREDYE